VLPERAALSILLTRSELDCLGSVEELLDTLPVESLYAGSGPGNPFDYFDEVAGGREVRLKRMDDRQTVGDVGTGGLVMLKAPIRVLATAWLFDHGTRTLFTSDSFGYLAVPQAEGPRVSREAPDTHVERLAREYLMSKFDWLATANLGPTKKALTSAFADFPVERIAPTHGCVIEGRPAVEAHVALMQLLLNELEDL
jgi:flavorubredoxin